MGCDLPSVPPHLSAMTPDITQLTRQNWKTTYLARSSASDDATTMGIFLLKPAQSSPASPDLLFKVLLRILAIRIPVRNSAHARLEWKIWERTTENNRAEWELCRALHAQYCKRHGAGILCDRGQKVTLRPLGYPGQPGFNSFSLSFLRERLGSAGALFL